eukprot:TRINITY_DN22896_c0_g1_i2.p2 TRINITY_DN22896_c0_g1~~TRINITY_DN22896_c0_g1_i2.p2  ORF type:complete len:173 (-),score=39.60 TRINITY_DN22896_c0_g1_i2:76-594(-)
MYHTGAYDPEGFLGCLTSIVLCFLGLQAGRILVHYQSHRDRLIRWCLWAVVLGVVAVGLCGGAENGGAVPINKNLWSASFVAALAAAANAALAACYVLQDVARAWDGEPFVYLGMNSISMYCLSEVFVWYFPLSFLLPADTHWWSMCSNVLGVTVWVITAYVMYRQGVFISL